MISARDKIVIESEVGKMLRRSEIQTSWFNWGEMKFFFTPPCGDRPDHVFIEGDTVEEIIEAIRLDVNQRLEDMRDELESSKLNYQFGDDGRTI